MTMTSARVSPAASPPAVVVEPSEPSRPKTRARRFLFLELPRREWGCGVAELPASRGEQDWDDDERIELMTLDLHVSPETIEHIRYDPSKLHACFPPDHVGRHIVFEVLVGRDEDVAAIRHHSTDVSDGIVLCSERVLANAFVLAPPNAHASIELVYRVELVRPLI